MKIEYPNYKGIGIEFIRKKLPQRDKKFLDDFLGFCSITAGNKKLRNIERIMLQLYDVMEISYSVITLEELRGVLAALNKSQKSNETQNDIKKVLKRYITWYYKDWSIRFNELKDIKTKSTLNEEKINPSTLLKPDEIENLIRGAESLRHKALIILFFESGGRPEEILKLKWKDVDLVRNEVKLHSSKTDKTRVNPLNESIIHIRRYKQEYPYSNVKADDFVFPSPINREKHITVEAFGDYLKRLGFQVLNRPIFPYLIRHTRLTQIHKTLPTQVACKFAGHSPEVARRYTHLTNDDVREAMLDKIYHVEEISTKDKQSIKYLEKEIDKIKGANAIQQKNLTKIKSENKKIWKWLEKITFINKSLLKAIMKDEQVEAAVKKHLKEMFDGEKRIFKSMQTT